MISNITIIYTNEYWQSADEECVRSLPDAIISRNAVMTSMLYACIFRLIYCVNM